MLVLAATYLCEVMTHRREEGEQFNVVVCRILLMLEWRGGRLSEDLQRGLVAVLLWKKIC